MLALLLCSLVSTAQGQYSSKTRTWSYLTASNDGDEYFIENARYVNDYGYRSAWLKCKEKSTKLNGRTYYNVSTLQLWQIDPGQGRYRLLSLATYDSNEKLLISHDFTRTEFTNVIPGSVGESIYRAVGEEVDYE